MPLTDIAIRNAKPGEKPIKLSDGAGLHVLIQPHGSKLWRLSYRLAGEQKTLALGIYPGSPSQRPAVGVSQREGFWRRVRIPHCSES